MSNLTRALLIERIQTIARLVEPISELTAQGELRRYGTVWYVDMQLDINPPPSALALSSPLQGSLATTIDSLKAALQELEYSNTCDVTTLALRTAMLETRVSQLREQLV